MKKHNGMRPQDIVILLKIIAIKNDDWRNADLAQSLQISPSEISEALNRCKIGGLMDSKKRKIHLNSFREFLVYGLKYVFPVIPGPLVRGIPTAHSAPPLNIHIASDEYYVWPFALGHFRGQSIEPLYITVPAVVNDDPQFYELIALVDAIRVGRAREYKIAVEELQKRLTYA
ncbi:MAG: hypothetical protein KAT15_04630 [Bacteroidales bacterium]|nr:hypothetical protein [Bacteroidales bacterium]